MIKRIVIIFIILITVGISVYKAYTYYKAKIEQMIASGELVELYYETIIQDKIWAHRVNSIERLQEIAPHYKGVEVDIMFVPSENNFDVYHPPALSSDLSLFDFLKSNEDSNTLYWLDFKNLDSIILPNAIDRLIYICNTLSLNQNRFIVESNQTKELQAFEQAGFKTSYYLHYPGLYTLSDEDLQAALEKINEGMKYPTTYISAPIHDYDILKKYYPDKEMLLWLAENKLTFADNMNRSVHEWKVASDPKVKVLLYWIATKAEIK